MLFFKQGGAQQEIRAFHIRLAPAGFIEEEIGGDAMLLRPRTAAETCVVRIRDRRHHPSYSLADSLATPGSQHRHAA